MPNVFENYLQSKEDNEIVIDLDDYIQKVMEHAPTDKESEQSLMLQIEDGSINLAALIAAASKLPQKLGIMPSNAATGKLRVIANGGEAPMTWSPHNVIKQTVMNMGRLGRMVQMAKNSVPNWGGSQIVIVPAPTAFGEPASDGLVKLNRCGCGNSFKASVINKGLNLQGIGEDPFGDSEDPKVGNDLMSLIDKLQNGFEAKPQQIRLVLKAPKSMRGKLQKAGREIAVLRKAFIPAMPLEKKATKKKNENLDLWKVRVDERSLGLPIKGVYWPIENEPLEILSIELIETVEQAEAEVQEPKGTNNEEQHN